ncbi:LSMD1 domain-containing protein Sbat isoform X2 [Brevipalpus obovatus]|uniref:LSMD1 domain-containing protein Sbat isoform X2 n=1 Tax=Brevipalpus obovatus TaxID=246614 RepID=UPI003D9EF889
MTDQEHKTSDKLQRLRCLLNKKMTIVMSDGRMLNGNFLCTDCHQNVILGACYEYHKVQGDNEREEPRALGLAMVPGRHIISIYVEKSSVESPEWSAGISNSTNHDDAPS